eukprot:COSAG06_NODE_4471_length_4220_cov_5.208202_5_plen_104_part_00
MGRLCHKDCEAGATVHEAGAGYFAQLRWQRSAPLFATEVEGVDGAPEPEAIRDGLATLNDFDNPEFEGREKYPQSGAHGNVCLFSAPFYTKSRTFAKTGSGQT